MNTGPRRTLMPSLAHVFSCEFCEISKNAFFTEHFWMAASIYLEAVCQRYSVRKVFLKISQNSLGNTCVRMSF